MTVEVSKNLYYHSCQTQDVLYASRHSETVRNLALALVIDRANVNVDMVCDMSSEYANKDAVEAVFADLNKQASEMVDDMLNTLKTVVKQQLIDMTVSARVRQLNYDKDGKLDDITVVIDTK